MKSTWLAVLFLFSIISKASSQPSQDPIRVACIGNSVTFGAGLKEPSLESYPAQLQKLLGDRFIVSNFGVSGTTLLQRGHRPYIKTQAFKDALAFNADVAVIHLGLNDTDPRNWPNYRNEFAADYTSLIDTLKKTNPKMRVYVCRLTPIFSGHPRFKSGTRDWFWQIQHLIPEIAKSNRAGLIDLHTPLYSRPDLFADNLHPDAEGAGIIAQTVFSFMTGARQGLQLPPVFTDGMVMQRGKSVSFYGKADAGGRVEIKFNNISKYEIADAYGDWKITFPTPPVGGPYEATIVCQNTKISLKDILIGDVWLCSGQSNMAFQLRQSEGAAEAIRDAAKHPSLRLFNYKPIAETYAVEWDSITMDKVNKLQYFSGSWETSDSISAADFSAIAFHFGKKINADLNVPIGLVQVAVGGTPMESWVDRYSMEHNEQLVDVLLNWRKSDFIQQFCRDRADLNLKRATKTTQRHPYEPCYNYEAGIAALTGFPIKGVLWYQGESNTHNPELYQTIFKTMVNSWRKQWGYEFPFYFVQLSSIGRPSWPYFRDVQRKLQKELPNTYMAVSSDLGDSLDVHPKRKKEIGERLALLAKRYTYQQPVTANGPEIQSVIQEGNKLILEFSFAKKLLASNKQPLYGFELVTMTGRHIPVTARIQDNTKLLLDIPDGEKIKGVAYAWRPFSRANLVNEAGLPASTFYFTLKKTQHELQ